MARSLSSERSASMAAAAVSPNSPDLTVEWRGVAYPAAPVASGAAFELFADDPGEGFLLDPRPEAAHRYRCFVHAREVHADGALVLKAPDPPLSAPLSRDVTLAAVQRLSQSPHGGEPEHALLSAVRATARIDHGTKMVKALSPRQAAVTLTSPPTVWGVCFREHDTAHLRTPDSRRILEGRPRSGAEVAFALRWRASGPGDYAVPTAEEYPGLVSMPGSDRSGASQILGTGFAPSQRHLLPEFITADMADLPLPDRAELLLYTSDGSEIVAYQYLAERGAWARMAGRQWREALDRLAGVNAGQEWFPVDEPDHVSLTGRYRDKRYAAVADPPRGFRIRAKSSVARFPLRDVIRTSATTTWQGVECAVAGHDDDWVRLRLRRPSAQAVRDTGAECVERGVYECWAPRR
ncbi:MAG: hypothetical protein ACRDXX_10015, partial [Stackebrandtia sp.]